MLRVNDIRKRYAEKEAVKGISFHVNPGEIVGLLGPNGAGKTTTINMILGVLEPSEGSIVIDGFNVQTERTKALSRTNFAAVYAQLPGNLTVSQNLRVFGMLYNVPHLEARIKEVLTEFNLASFIDTKTGVLSSGEQTRVVLAKAMLNKPALLLLDEPTASLDPSTARAIRERIHVFARSMQGGVLWTSHNMQEVTEMCDRVLFVSKGEILLEGDPKLLPAQYNKESLEELFISVANEPLEFKE